MLRPAIRPASESDFESIWAIFQHVCASGDTYIYDETVSKEQAHAIWMENTFPFVAEIDGTVVATFVVRQNKLGRGSHVANAGFMVAPEFQNNGIGQQLAEYALAFAKEEGFKAMQFNMVVSTNKRSIHLWQSLGLSIIGTVPKGFRHKTKGLVDFHILHKHL